MMTQTDKLEQATLGGGCFWCIEAVFTEVKGVKQAISGYSGGDFEATYEEVCTGTTGHAEVVQITFDPKIISFRKILEIFFSVHDPTQLNRQGADIGSQYRSAIFYHTDSQKDITEQVLRELGASNAWGKPIVTEVTAFTRFYRAEEYHQQYYRKNPFQGYCQMVISPKVMKFREKFNTYLLSPEVSH
ncbi:MAG: peptide-methionine (S)-S-oxide reductase MsrA [Candidatus Heimdallarchaeota archaeon]